MRYRRLAGALMLAAAAPAAAADSRFRVTGTVNAPSGAALGVPLAGGNRFTGTFTLASGGNSGPAAPLGGQGQGAGYGQTLRALSLTLDTAAGPRTVSLKPGKFGNGLVYDNGFSVRAGGLIDYAGFVVPVEGGPGGLTSILATDLALPRGVYLANFSFARVGPTSLLTSTALPDFGSFFGAPGATYFGLFSFRSGTAFTAAQFLALPLSEVTITAAQVTLLPEPGTWALLIAGFGAFGVAARRRRAATSPARL